MSAPIYESHNKPVQHLLDQVVTGEIGLPDLQRPFVWKNDKVRDLLDSMMRGYPIGYVMLWQSPADVVSGTHHIGENKKEYKTPKALVIDGQQRLTALLAALYGIEVRDKSFAKRSIVIAYDPITHEFKNADASTARDPRFVPSVADVFAAKSDNTLGIYRKNFLKRLNESNVKKGLAEITDEDENAVENGLNDLLNLINYAIPCLEIYSTADEEAVSDIFVRVNSQGQALKQDDFIMTLLSVYEPEMRERIEQFCQDSHIPAQGTSYNPLVRVSPTHVIRATVGVGFHRARLYYAYQILRGRDLKTKITSAETREANFKIFGAALNQVLNLNNWHEFINILGEAGYVSKAQVSSENGLAFCYAIYLIAKYEFELEPLRVRRLLRRWYFASSLAFYYVGSFESAFEKQLNDIEGLKSADEFEAYFERSMSALLTDDYFRVKLPEDLNVNETKGATWYGFVASQVVLGCKALFSTQPLSTLITVGASGTKCAYDKHHLFPDNYLKQRDCLENRSNRGNFTLVDYQNNIYISDAAPSEYVAKYRADLGEEEYERNCREHALPLGFENMDYEEFLTERRTLMAQLIKEAYLKL